MIYCQANFLHSPDTSTKSLLQELYSLGETGFMRILQERGRSVGFLLHSKVMHIPEYHERIYT